MKIKYVFPVAERSFIKFGCQLDKDFAFTYWRLPRLGRFVALAWYLCMLGDDVLMLDYDFFESLRDYVGFDLIHILNAHYEGLETKYLHMNQRKKTGFWLGFIASYQKNVLKGDRFFSDPD